MQISFQASPNTDQMSPNAGRIQTFGTPYKKSIEQTAQKTLKKAILQKLEAGKYNSASNKKVKKNLFPKQTKEQLKFSDDQDEPSKEKEFILRNQSQSHPGFYEYMHWLKLHAESFSYVDRKYVEGLWKILRLINYGEVFIPTGLVYDILMEVKKNATVGGFQKIINKFLKENDTSDSLRSFKDMKNYIDIKQIQKAYKCLQYQEKEKDQQQRASHLKSRSQSASNVFERNFKQARVRTEKKITSMCSNIIKESEKMSQKPRISIYKSEGYQSLVKPQRICKNPCGHKFKNEQERYLQENSGVLNNLFKAKQLDKSIFEGNIDNIPGVVSHLSRNQYCQAEKLKAQREALRPQYSKKKIY